MRSAVPFFGPMATSAIEDVSGMVGRREYRGLAGAATGLATSAGLPRLGPPAARKLSPVLERSAARNYLSTLLPGSKRLVSKAEQIARGLAEKKPIELTRGRFIKRAATEKAAAGPPAGNAYANVPPVQAQKVQAIFDTLDELEQRHSAIKGTNISVNEPLLKAIEGIRDTVRGMRDSLGNIAAESLDDFRDKLYRGVVDATGNVRQSAPATAKAIEKSSAASIKRLLDAEYPTAKGMNDNYHLWSKTLDFLEDARRREVSAKSGIITGSSQGFGALTQKLLPRPIRTIPMTVTVLFDSVAWNTVSGAAKQSFAEAVAKADWKMAEGILIGLAASSPGLQGKGSKGETQ